MARQYMNLAEIYGQADAARANQAQMENNRMLQERQRRQFEREDRQYADDVAIKDIYRGAVTPEGELDETRVIGDLLKRDPVKALEVKDSFAKRKAEQAKTQSETNKATLENKKATISYLKDKLATIQDDASYQAFKQEANELGATDLVKTAPPQFDAQWQQSQMLNADKFLERSTPKYEKVDLGGRIQIIDVNPFTNPSYKGSNFTKVPTIGEQESMRHNRVSEGHSAATLQETKRKNSLDGGAGKPPSGYRFLTDGSLEAIKGGPADIKAGELGAKADARKKMQLGTTANTIDAVDTALNQAGFFETGMTGAVMSKVAGSDAYNLRKTAETIKANLGFNELQAMREASPTGGALGAIAVQELTALQSTIANIDPNQSEAQLKANLKKVRKHVNAWRKTMGGEEIPEQVEKTQAPRGADVRSEADKILGL